MRYVRYAIVLTTILLLTACGRQLPDEYFLTNTDFTQEAVAPATEELTAEVTEVTADSATPEATELATDSTTPEATEVAQGDPIVELVANADPAVGEEIFTTTGIPPCISCHYNNSEDTLVGPGLLNVGERAANRIDGMVAERYLYDSITAPNDYIVEGFAPNLMPPNFGDLYTDEQIYDIIAYLMTLKG